MRIKIRMNKKGKDMPWQIPCPFCCGEAFLNHFSHMVQLKLECSPLRKLSQLGSALRLFNFRSEKIQ